MRATILLAVLGTFVSSEVIQMDIRSTGSLRTRLLNKRGLEDLTPRNNLRNAKQRALRPQPIFDYYDNYFLGSIALGTPPQMFNNMLLDTGSSNLWVIDAMCNMSACQGSPASGYNKTLFDTSMSSTYQAQSTLFNINYGSASVQGHLAMDMFALRNLTYATQQFGVVTSLDMMFGEEPIDGIFGLAWPSLAANSVVPPLQNLLPQLDAPLFTVWLDRAYGPMTAGEINGVITYGAIDPNHCDPSDVQYTPLTAETYWQFNLNGFSVGSYSNPSRQTAVSDTGTPRLGAPSADVNGLMTAINATYVAMYDHYEIDCNAMAPDLVFTIGGRQYNIPFSVYTLDLGMGPSSCVVTVYPVNGGGFGPSWILGDTFIRTYCNVYDIGNQQIGFGRAFHSDIPTATLSM